MSIEKNIERIADALEQLVNRFRDTDRVPEAKAPATEQVSPGVAVAVEALSAGVKEAVAVSKRGRPAKAEAPAAPVVEKPVVDEATPTLEEVTNQLREFVRVKGMEAAKKVLLEFGAGRISELTEDKYAGLSKKLKAGLK